MARVPGSMNGGVPPNLKWDPLNPPLKCDNCEMVGIHRPDCDGKSSKSPLRQSECELLNEHREWTRLGISTNVVPRDLFRMGNQIQALINIVVDHLGVDRDELNDEYRNCTVKEMSRIRLANQDEIKRVNFGLPPSGLLGPDGQKL